MVAHKSISVGDRVSFTLGTTAMRGVVVDDRGPIGANQVRIFRVRIPNDPYDDDEFEMPEDELALATQSLNSLPVVDVLTYLEQGGLVQMLKANASGGKNQPRVWLGRDSLGNVVHTFIAERGNLGGSTIPVAALYDNHIFTPKLSEVEQFLTTFGLTESDAQQVAKAVGTAP